MVITQYKPEEDMIDKLQQLKGKVKLKFDGNLSNHYDQMSYMRRSITFEFEEDPFSRNAEGVTEIFHEVLFLMKILQTKPQCKSMKLI